MKTTLALALAFLAPTAGADAGDLLDALAVPARLVTPRVMVEPAVLDFGNVPVGRVVTRDVRVFAPDADVELGSEVGLDVAGAGLAVDPGRCRGGLVQPLRSCWLTVTFEPLAPGPASAVVGLYSGPGRLDLRASVDVRAHAYAGGR